MANVFINSDPYMDNDKDKCCKHYDVVDKYQINQKKAFDFLDTLELNNYLNQDWEVTWIMHKIQKEHGFKYPVEASIFNCISVNEFLDYIRKRYKNQYKIYRYTTLKIKGNDTHG